MRRTLISELHKVPQLPGPHLYCGPTAICAITGLNQMAVLAAAHRYIKCPHNRPIVGMSTAEVVGTLALLGYRSETYALLHGDSSVTPTFAQFRRYEMLPFKGAVILELTGHYCAVTYDEYVCNHVDGEVIPIAFAPNGRRKVRYIIEVEPL
jgi:hypothetical protein